MEINKTYIGDNLEILKTFSDEFVNCVVTSPPFWGLRDYGVDGQLGLESTPEEYVNKIVEIFKEVKRVLKNDGTLWLNLGDTYVSSPKGNKTPSGLQSKNYGIGKDVAMKKNVDWGNLKMKDLVGIPWMVAFALRTDGWYLRSDIIWNKPNPMPESVRDRPTKSHEYIFLLSKSAKYYYDADAIRDSYEGRPLNRWGGSKMKQVKGKMKEYLDMQNVGNSSVMREGHPIRPNDKGSNKRSVWTVATKSYPKAHFAVFPEELIEPCILAGCPEGGWVLDPFMGSGTTAQVALINDRNCVGIELNPEYEKFISERIQNISHTITAREKIKTWFDVERG